MFKGDDQEMKAVLTKEIIMLLDKQMEADERWIRKPKVKPVEKPEPTLVEKPTPVEVEKGREYAEDGLPIYRGGWGKVPDHLKAGSKLNRMGYRQPEKPAAYFKQGERTYLLYDVRVAQPLTIETATVEELYYWIDGVKKGLYQGPQALIRRLRRLKHVKPDQWLSDKSKVEVKPGIQPIKVEQVQVEKAENESIPPTIPYYQPTLGI